MRYLNIFLILVIMGVSAVSFAPMGNSMPSGISHHTGNENGMLCHCEFHVHMETTKTFMVSCDWSDKLSAKQISELRSIPVKDPIANPATISYILHFRSDLQPDNVIISLELPPPRHIS